MTKFALINTNNDINENIPPYKSNAEHDQKIHSSEHILLLSVGSEKSFTLTFVSVQKPLHLDIKRIITNKKAKTNPIIKAFSSSSS